MSDFDRRHVLTGIWLYELPFGRGKRFASGTGGVLNHVIGGWSLNGALTAYTGEPFTVLSGVRTSNFSHVSRAVFKEAPVKAEFQETANKVGPVYFRDPSAFGFPAAGDNGMGRNLFRGAGYWNTDMGLQKVFQLTERVRMQFRLETFNTLTIRALRRRRRPRADRIKSPARGSANRAARQWLRTRRRTSSRPARVDGEYNWR